ncbi:MAG: hypothetical protein AAGU32_18275, partial [Bacillota bacterium]
YRPLPQPVCAFAFFVFEILPSSINAAPISRQDAPRRTAASPIVFSFSFSIFHPAITITMIHMLIWSLGIRPLTD